MFRLLHEAAEKERVAAEKDRAAAAEAAAIRQETRQQENMKQLLDFAAKQQESARIHELEMGKQKLHMAALSAEERTIHSQNQNFSIQSLANASAGHTSTYNEVQKPRFIQQMQFARGGAQAAIGGAGEKQLALGGAGEADGPPIPKVKEEGQKQGEGQKEVSMDVTEYEEYLAFKRKCEEDKKKGL